MRHKVARAAVCSFYHVFLYSFAASLSRGSDEKLFAVASPPSSENDVRFAVLRKLMKDMTRKAIATKGDWSISDD